MQPHAPLDPAQAKLILQVIRTKVQQFLKGGNRRQAETDDLEQELAVRVLEKLPRFNPSRAGLKTYVSRVVDSAYLDRLRRLAASRRTAARERGSLQCPAPDEDGRHCNRAQLVDGEQQQFKRGLRRRAQKELDDMKVDVHSLTKSLPPGDQHLCEEVQGKTIPQVASAMGVARGTVYRRLKALRSHFEQRGLEEYLE